MTDMLSRPVVIAADPPRLAHRETDAFPVTDLDEASTTLSRQHVLLVGSSGGHLAQLLALRPWWATVPRTWVTFDTSDARSQLLEEAVVYAHHPTTRNLRNLVRNTFVAVRLMRRLKPTMVVSTGAAVAFPFFVLAKLAGVPRVYIEVFDRVDSRTLTGRLCRPLSSEFLVQWEQQVPLYKGARVLGTLL